jgi:hypothetical protein
MVFYWCYVNDLHTTHAVVCWVTTLCINLEDDNEEEDDDAGLSQWCHGGGNGQSCSTWAAKDEPPSNDNNDGDGDEDYDVFYRHLGMN